MESCRGAGAGEMKQEAEQRERKSSEETLEEAEDRNGISKSSALGFVQLALAYQVSIASLKSHG